MQTRPYILLPFEDEALRSRRMVALRALVIGAFVLVALAVTASLLTSCASAPVHPGAANTVDSQIYDSLVSIQASIEQAKVEFGADPAAKVPLNRLIVSYNAAQDAYKSYHQLAVSSGTPPDATTLQAMVTALVTDVAAVRAQFGKKTGALECYLCAVTQPVIRPEAVAADRAWKAYTAELAAKGGQR